MLDVGGQDATEAFEDVGHSDEAREILDGLLVGTLKRQVQFLNHQFMLSNCQLTAFSIRRETQSQRSHKLQPPQHLLAAQPVWVLVSTLSFFSVVLRLSAHTSTCRVRRARRKGYFGVCWDERNLWAAEVEGKRPRGTFDAFSEQCPIDTFKLFVHPKLR